MNRREFFKGLAAAAVVATAPIPKLGPKIRMWYDSKYGITIDADGATLTEVYEFCRHQLRQTEEIKSDRKA